MGEIFVMKYLSPLGNICVKNIQSELRGRSKLRIRDNNIQNKLKSTYTLRVIIPYANIQGFNLQLVDVF